MKKDEPGISPIMIAVAVALFLLLVGFSCNVHIEIKQKPTKVETKE